MANETPVVHQAEREPAPPGSGPEQQKETQNKSDKSPFEKVRNLVVNAKHSTPALVVGWSIVALAFLATVPVAYLSWYVMPVHLWRWANTEWWHWLPSFFGFCLLMSIPVYAVWGASILSGLVADLALSTATRKAQETVRETEEEAIRHLEQTDMAGLLPLLKYSRAQLEAYYQVGLSQTRRGFYNSVVAMWLGFILLLMGVALYVVPMQKIGIAPPTQDIRTLVIGGASIIEFISALFLWVYRSSMAELIHFYNSQMHVHTSILCFRIASTMEKAKGDDTKKVIVDKVLDWKSTPENPPPIGAQGLRSLISAATPKTAA